MAAPSVLTRTRSSTGPPPARSRQAAEKLDKKIDGNRARSRTFDAVTTIPEDTEVSFNDPTAEQTSNILSGVNQQPIIAPGSVDSLRSVRGFIKGLELLRTETSSSTTKFALSAGDFDKEIENLGVHETLEAEKEAEVLFALSGYLRDHVSVQELKKLVECISRGASAGDFESGRGSPKNLQIPENDKESSGEIDAVAPDFGALLCSKLEALSRVQDSIEVERRDDYYLEDKGQEKLHSEFFNVKEIEVETHSSSTIVQVEPSQTGNRPRTSSRAKEPSLPVPHVVVTRPSRLRETNVSLDPENSCPKTVIQVAAGGRPRTTSRAKDPDLLKSS
eukprot:m.340199 g.340199  ORF g.340199 m.340199 type:complete len:334 (-) comp19180_c0_seq1:167-1168(-)